MSGLKIGVIGATGMVGRRYLQILEASPLEVAQLRLYASARSVGSRMTFAGESLAVEEFTVEACRGLDIAFFTVSTELARQYAPQVAEQRHPGDRRQLGVQDGPRTCRWSSPK